MYLLKAADLATLKMGEDLRVTLAHMDRVSFLQEMALKVDMVEMIGLSGEDKGKVALVGCLRENGLANSLVYCCVMSFSALFVVNEA